MLAASLRALQRAAALQATPASAAASTLPGLAAALQRLSLQQPSWAAAQAGGQRPYAAAAADGGSGGEAGGSSQQQEGQEQQAASQLRSESGQLTFADADQALEAWGKAMDEGAPCVHALCCFVHAHPCLLLFSSVPCVPRWVCAARFGSAVHLHDVCTAGFMPFTPCHHGGLVPAGSWCLQASCAAPARV